MARSARCAGRASRVYAEEIFGPVLSVVRVATYDDGVRLINTGAFGNGTAIFTNNGGAARRFQNEVEVGMIGINVPIPVPVATFSFGGWRQSLFGDTKAHGADLGFPCTRIRAPKVSRPPYHSLWGFNA